LTRKISEADENKAIKFFTIGRKVDRPWGSSMSIEEVLYESVQNQVTVFGEVMGNIHQIYI
jgi:hypothetical protein